MTTEAAFRDGSRSSELGRLLEEGVANGAGRMSLTTVITESEIDEYLAAVDRAMPRVLEHD